MVRRQHAGHRGRRRCVGGGLGADALWAIIGLLIGNIVGGAVMALHSAQGPRLGLPQMISSRAQFGVFGAVLPLVLVVLLYLGFAATGTVLAGQAINQIVGVDTPLVGIVIYGLLTFVVATLGYRYIHVLGQKPFTVASFLLATPLSAGWQLTYGPYVADYSRYLPRNTKASRTLGFLDNQVELIGSLSFYPADVELEGKAP